MLSDLVDALITEPSKVDVLILVLMEYALWHTYPPLELHPDFKS